MRFTDSLQADQLGWINTGLRTARQTLVDSNSVVVDFQRNRFRVHRQKLSMSGLCGSFAQVWTQWSYSGAERKTTYPLERWSYSKQTTERIIRGENVIQPSEPIIGFTFQVWAKKKNIPWSRMLRIVGCKKLLCMYKVLHMPEYFCSPKVQNKAPHYFYFIAFILLLLPYRRSQWAD